MSGRVTRSKQAAAKQEHDEVPARPTPTATASKKRKRQVPTIKQEEVENSSTPGKEDDKRKVLKTSEVDELPTKSTTKASTKTKPYGLSPGETPFPKFLKPTPDECQNVNDILEDFHGKVAAPKTIPTPSLENSGCGEVPSVLDALIRTRLSAATNNQNSSRAFRGLVQRFGIIDSGIGKGSVNWNAVRQAPQKEVFEAIKSGGLADVKSRDIKKILDLVYEENQARKENIKQEKKGNQADVREEADEKRAEVDKAEAEVLTLDHLHLLSNEDAFQKLLEYPGIGPKTASCVLLFCMQRPSFAVDTHVFRLTKWLGWVPTEQQAKSMAKAEAKETGEKVKSATVTREKTYAHLDVRIPDKLKYSLHYLLIKHGKHCPWCSAKAGQASKIGTCPLAHLMSGKGRNKGLAKEIKAEQAAEESSTDGDDMDSDAEQIHGINL